MPKVWNKRDPNTPADAVYVGRPYKWGNPYLMHDESERDHVVNLYRKSASLMPADFFDELRGKDLVCWCAPKACHADVLLELANVAKTD